MKNSGFRSIFHVYAIFMAAIFGIIILSGVIFCSLITIKAPDESIKRSDYPKNFTENFKEQITFKDNKLQIKREGLDLLDENDIGIQILDMNGREISSYKKPAYSKDTYSNSELIYINKDGYLKSGGEENTAFLGGFNKDGNEYIYILYFPVKISKVTMYLNGIHFTTGKSVMIIFIAVLIFIILILGILYGLWMTRNMRDLTSSIKDIPKRRYIQVRNNDAFGDVYDSLNDLDNEIRESDRLAENTERMRKEWIANITHDLKTPLSPIRGYAEILNEKETISSEEIKKYSQIMLKNVSNIQTLINDLKLTYQLDNGIIPVQKKEQDIIRFLKEVVIDILNNPEYENRSIEFDYTKENVMFLFDAGLMARAFQNLIINAFVHGDDNTKLRLKVDAYDDVIQINVEDNGKGMRQDEVNKLFERYYRGTNTEQKGEGTGLGLAIAKNIIELHDGTIIADSILGKGTTFKICFPKIKVN